MSLTIIASALAVVLSILALTGYALSAGRLLERIAQLTTIVGELRSEIRTLETLRSTDQRHDNALMDAHRRITDLETARDADRETHNALVRRVDRLETLSEGGTPARGVPAARS